VTRHRRQSWLLTRWAKRNRQAALDTAAAAQEAEQEAARRRVLSQATELLPVVGPAYSWRPARRPAPVRETPLLTPGQAARSRGATG
jgi:hypothetical protein